MIQAAPVGTVSLAGAALFAWPFLGMELPDSTPAWALMIACVAALLFIEVGTRQLDSRAIALRLAVIIGIGGFNPIFFLVLCAGFIFGSSFGFLAGALSLLVSAVVGGGVGPWVPYQVFAIGWVGVAAGVAGRWSRPSPRLREVVLLAIVGGMTGYLFGVLMNVTDWIAFFRGHPTLGWEPGIAPATALIHFWNFYMVTSFGYDSFRAAGNVVMVLALGAPVMAALARFRLRLAFEVVEQ